MLLDEPIVIKTSADEYKKYIPNIDRIWVSLLGWKQLRLPGDTKPDA
jgi:hypothetical protein